MALRDTEPFFQGVVGTILRIDETIKPVRIAAVGDFHIKSYIPESLQHGLMSLDEDIDVLVVAGDITDGGRIPEVEIAAKMFTSVTVPMVAVLGNHDRRGLRRTVMRRLYERAGIRLLDGEAMVIPLRDGRRLGIAGLSGTGGGFWPDEADARLGGKLTKAIAVKSRREAMRLGSALASLKDQNVDLTLVVTHFAPTVSTLGNEPQVKYWMLGNSLLGRVIDAHDVDLVFHGHAHLGNEAGTTPGGTPVRNVAMHVTGGISVYDVASRRDLRPVTEVPVRRPTSITSVSVMDLIRTS